MFCSMLKAKLLPTIIRACVAPPPPAVCLRYNSLMTQEANEVLKRTLALPAEDRAELAGSLIESLDMEQAPNVEADWSEEVARRIQDLDSDKVQAIPWADVRRRIAAKLGNGS